MRRDRDYRDVSTLNNAQTYLTSEKSHDERLSTFIEPGETMASWFETNPV